MQKKCENIKWQWGHWPFIIMEESVASLTLGLQLSVKCKGTWGQKNVFKSETHYHKWGKV
jgi:hypothetical protein